MNLPLFLKRKPVGGKVKLYDVKFNDILKSDNPQKLLNIDEAKKEFSSVIQKEFGPLINLDLIFFDKAAIIQQISNYNKGELTTDEIREFEKEFEHIMQGEYRNFSQLLQSQQSDTQDYSFSDILFIHKEEISKKLRPNKRAILRENKCTFQINIFSDEP